MCSFLCHRFPNIGNTCYMNATLQSLFSLQVFIKDIRREESCWKSNLTTHLLKCLADLHSTRTSCNRERKISLLKTLKRSIAKNYSDFCGEEQQDAHEFLSVLLSQLKEEGVSLRTRVGLHPYTCTIEANFEFELLSTRTCLRVLVVQLKRFSVNSRGVKLHNRLHISPQLCLQAHSRANVRRPGMPKPHLTQGDCYETSHTTRGCCSLYR
ncbi:hypothetical protein SKAU_G00216450 [Synaphobranchus kaupii]|uniref:USP domain-containing protein n=1 Tax=Synaphobranchus kaupii TaxID=118154 RepID=A0A9Q1IVK7_SYNKA|nr:hypothetical protein SKAU_G00216450 [Synaphobranchus kaupii]